MMDYGSFGLFVKQQSKKIEDLSMKRRPNPSMYRGQGSNIGAPTQELTSIRVVTGNPTSINKKPIHQMAEDKKVPLPLITVLAISSIKYFLLYNNYSLLWTLD